MTTLYDKYLSFRATLNLPETHEPLVTVPRVRGERVPVWQGPSSDRKHSKRSKYEWKDKK